MFAVMAEFMVVAMAVMLATCCLRATTRSLCSRRRSRASCRLRALSRAARLRAKACRVDTRLSSAANARRPSMSQCFTGSKFWLVIA